MRTGASVDAIVLDVQFQNQEAVSDTLDDAMKDVSARQAKIAKKREKISDREKDIDVVQGEADDIANEPDHILTGKFWGRLIGVDNTEDRIKVKEGEAEKIGTEIEDIETDIDVERERISTQVEDMTEAFESFTEETKALEGIVRETEQLMAEINRKNV